MHELGVDSNYDDLAEQEVDIIELITSNADVSSQYVIFKNGSDKLYGINVAKVEELVSYSTIEMAENSNQNRLFSGVAKIRGEMIPIVKFDRWLNGVELENEAYELLMICNYSNKKLGIVIKDVLGILSIDSKNLIDNSEKDEKTSYVTDISLGGESGLCLIFDSDKLIVELFPESSEEQIKKAENLSTLSDIKGKVFSAEDSSAIRVVLKQLYAKLGLDYEIFNNGQLLLDRLLTLQGEDISLIITDLEMPVMDGLTLISKIKENPQYNKIPIIMNTNMANDSITQKAKSLGVNKIISKLDVDDLTAAINENARKD